MLQYCCWHYDIDSQAVLASLAAGRASNLGSQARNGRPHIQLAAKEAATAETVLLHLVLLLRRRALRICACAKHRTRSAVHHSHMQMVCAVLYSCSLQLAKAFRLHSTHAVCRLHGS